jgi:hypothetical protein
VRPLLWLAGASVLSAALLGARFGREVWLGMFAPLLVVSVTWVLAERVHKANPSLLTSAMITAFAGKLVFFGAYVGLVIGVLDVRRAPFVASFAGYFIGLHMIEAHLLKRLFVSDIATRRGA